MIVKDLNGANKFWTALGGEPAQLAQLKLTKLPGVLYLMRKGDNTGGTEGSSVEYVGYKVKSLRETKVDKGKPVRKSGMTNTLWSSPPDGIKVLPDWNMQSLAGGQRPDERSTDETRQNAARFFQPVQSGSLLC